MRVETILNPAEIATLPQRDLRGSVCVVFDVLRATSTMLTAFSNGVNRIYPAATIEEARTRHRESAPDTLLGGERGGVRIEGFHLGNSPREYTAEAVRGREIIMTTTNGTVALRACAGARRILVGALLNVHAMAAFLRRSDEDQHVLLVAAGTGSRFALEDGLGAGALLSKLIEVNGDAVSYDDASRAMLSLHGDLGGDPLGTLRASENGRKLVELGLEKDVEWCARTSTIPLVAVLEDGALQGRRVEV